MTQDPDAMAEGLDPEAAAFLDSVRELDQPSPSDRRRVRRRVLAAVATGAASAAGGTATAAAATAGGATGAGVVGTTLAAKVWIGVAIGLVGAGVAGGVATLTPDEPVVSASRAGSSSESEVGDPPSVSESVSESASDSDSESPSDSESLSDSESPSDSEHSDPEGVSSQPVPPALPAARSAQVPDAPGPTHDSPPAAPREPASADPDTLGPELALIRRAHAAANDGNHTESLRILAEHASRFPSGSLATEREGARALSLCGAGRMGEGQRVAERFLRAHPGSPLRARVSRACAE